MEDVVEDGWKMGGCIVDVRLQCCVSPDLFLSHLLFASVRDGILDLR